MALTVLDIFSGCGGLSTGFKQAGFRVIAASDFDKSAAETHRRNHPGVKFVCGDITKARVRRKIVDAAKGVEVIVGGVPCQAYSTARGKRDPRDHRGYLFWEFVKIIRKLQPRYVVMENVPGLVSMPSGGEKLTKIIEDEFAEIGYRVHHKILDAADYGVPQRRRRVFFLASRNKLPDFPPPKTLKPVTCREAVDDLKDKPDDQRLSHVRTQHSPEFAAKIARAKPGDPVTDFKQACYRCRADAPSQTITTNHQAKAHYEQDRTLTARECARLQGFRDDFLFCGNSTDVFRQIGNAVPPPLAAAVAKSVLAAAAELPADETLAPPTSSVTPFDKAVRSARRHLAQEKKCLMDAASRQLEADCHALEIGKIIDQVLLGKRGVRGKRQMKQFCERTEIRKTLAYEYRRLYRSAGSAKNLKRWKVPRQYWIALLGFNTSDVFGFGVRELLLENQIRNDEGFVEPELLDQLLRVFRVCHRQVRSNFFNQPILFDAETPHEFTFTVTGESKDEVAEKLMWDYKRFTDANNTFRLTMSEMLGKDVTQRTSFCTEPEKPQYTYDWSKRWTPGAGRTTGRRALGSIRALRGWCRRHGWTVVFCDDRAVIIKANTDGVEVCFVQPAGARPHPSNLIKPRYAVFDGRSVQFLTAKTGHGG